MEETHDAKTLDDVFLREMQIKFGFTPIVARAVLENAKLTFKSGLFDSETVNVGQMRILAVSSQEKAGNPMAKCKLVPITLTVDNGEDDEEIQNQNIPAWRQAVICRITEEAYDQEALLTEQDIARILRCSIRTVKRDIKHLKSLDIFIPIRGDVIGTGRGQTHKVKINNVKQIPNSFVIYPNQESELEKFLNSLSVCIKFNFLNGAFRSAFRGRLRCFAAM